MVFWNLGKVCPAKLLENIIFALDYAQDGVLGSALIVHWNAYSLAFSFGKVNLVDAILATITILLI
ncbi:hypothetical protein EJ02DRAFT_459926 [Clathrospora elynae]|uniref:Uncharacterized protein n=1 Tax=Clathrospora elynae TaxID=706981 RepID=A0A6A5S5M2_9PLEO|nr:hypothetical protein EJ02DRAFT_459926 [Clathrospora elynae]